MVNISDLIRRDLQMIWHPCSQMKDYETLLPLHVVKAKGAYLILNDGTKILDAISSWWCKHLGHGHPRLINAMIQQAQDFEHVILANTTNHVIVNLSEELASLTTRLKKIFYASDGSCAVEVALKLAIHARRIKGESHKTEILALSNGYHGETLFALAVSDQGIYRHPYAEILPKVHFLKDIPYVASRWDPLWQNCDEEWKKIEMQLQQYQPNLTALIMEPIVQGVAGMRVYSADFLSRLAKWCKNNNVYLIADEIMTGFGRTGKMFACEYAEIEPDFLCMGKGMTGGVLPMSAVMMTDEIYQLFYNDYELGESFLHSHTHSGNALAAAVATACISVIKEEKILENTIQLEKQLIVAMGEVAEKTKRLSNIRAIGGIVAADLLPNGTSRLGYQVFRQAVKFGALLRPLGNTIYWVPPLNISEWDIRHLRDITIKAVDAAYVL